MPELYLDIETMPASPDSTMGEAALEGFSAPSNYKDPAKIAAYIEEHKEEALAVTALQPMRGQRIAAIGWAVEDNDPTVIVRQKHEAEIKLLQNWWKAVEKDLRAYHTSKHGGHGPGDLWRTGVQFVGHNVRFDLVSLQWAHIRAGCQPELSFHLLDKPWDGGIIDTCEMARFGAGRGDSMVKGASLKNLCLLLGWEMEHQLEPQEIFKAWEDEEYEKLVSYCAEDIEMTRRLYHRIMDYTR